MNSIQNKDSNESSESDKEEGDKKESVKNRKDEKKKFNSEYHQLKQQLSDEELFSQSMLFGFFNHLYFTLFKMLNDQWVAEKPNIMEFTQFLQKIYEEQFLYNITQVTNEYIDQISSINLRQKQD